MATNNTVKKATLDIQAKLDTFLQSTQNFKTAYADSFDYIPTGIEPLDVILGGGVVVGGIVMLVGRPGCGKSSLAVNIMGQFQKKSKGKALCVYIDAEHAMSTARLSQLGVKAPKIRPYVNTSLEDVFKILNSIVSFKQENNIVDLPTVVVWDSLANTITEKESSASDPKEVIGYKARFLSMKLPEFSKKLYLNNICLIVVNQLRDDVAIAAGPSPKQILGIKKGDTIPGGRAVLFNAFQLLYLYDVGRMEEKTYGFDGRKVNILAIKNKLFPPDITTMSAFSYVGGYSNLWSKIELLKSLKLINTSGAWMSIEGYDNKFQNKKIPNMYIEDKKFRDIINTNFINYAETVKVKYEEQTRKAQIDQDIEILVQDNKQTPKKESKTVETPPPKKESKTVETPPPKKKSEKESDDIFIKTN